MIKSMEHQLFKVTQNAVIKNSEGLVLILKHTTGNWLLPGGKINSGENSMDGLKREIKEETGIENFEINKILDIDSWIEDDKGTYVVTFLIDAPNVSEIKLSDEHIEYAWVGLDDIDNYHFWHEDIKKRIKMAFK
jgi:8-oxo-dGTP pyrophosphatase MutT (NUDIX family)